MSTNQNVRVRPDTLQADQAAYNALQTIANYKSVNARYSQESIANDFETMQAKRQAEANAQLALAAARDDAAAAEWQFHNSMLGVKDQVIALFGDDSNEAQALGLVKKSERKRPARAAKKAASAAQG